MQSERSGMIYKAFCLVSGKAYVGQTVSTLLKVKARHARSARDYRRGGYNSAMSCAIRKYGIESFVWGVVEDGITRSELDAKEIAAISGHNTKAPHGYNLTDGGEGRKGSEPWNKGVPHSEATKEKLRQRAINRSPEVRARMSAAQKSRLPESRTGQIAALRKRVRDPEYRRMISDRVKESYNKPGRREQRGVLSRQHAIKVGHCAGKKLKITE